MGRTVRWIGVWCCLLLLSGSAMAKPVLYYFDEPKELEAWAGRVAVFTDGQPRGAVEALVAEVGVANPRIDGHAIDGWYFIEAPAFGNDAEGTRALADAMAQRGQARGLFVTDVFVDEYGGAMFPTPWVLVRFTPEVDRAQASALLNARGFGVEMEQDFGGISNLYRARTSHASGRAVLDAAADLARRGDTVYAEPDMSVTGQHHLIPNDAGFPDCWGLRNTGQFGCCNGIDLGAVSAWDITIGNSDIHTIIFDTGVQQDHPDINQLPGWDTTNQDNPGGGPVVTCDNHGTAVAGCVSAIINNQIGTVGIAPGTRIRSVRFGISTSCIAGFFSTQTSWLVDGLGISVLSGARVTNSSFRWSPPSSTIADAYQNARNNGIIHFGAAGNSPSGTLDYPASLPSVNAVAAIGPTGALTSFSNFGPGLAFAAPGIDIYTTDRTGSDGYGEGDYAFVQGTSFAAPYAAGVAALVLSVNPNLTPAQVEGIMQGTALDLGQPGYDTTFGWGLPRADLAMAAAMNQFGCGSTLRGPCCQPNGSPSCQNLACCTAVCAVAPFCCTTGWNSTCASLALQLCVTCGGGGCGTGDAGNCCTPSVTPFCDNGPCCELVCAQDPFCCNSAWDALCAQQALTACAVCIGCGSSSSGSCCMPKSTPYCNQESCCESICAFDPFCCNTAWDDVCALEATNTSACSCPVGACCLGDGTCTLGPAWQCESFGGVYQGDNSSCSGNPCLACGVSAAGPCCESNGTPYCNDEACCLLVCSFDPFCCNTTWDGICASGAANNCGSLCTGNCSADINNDGVVDADDLGILLSQFGCTGVCSADINNDGVVDADDLGILLSQFGCTG